MMLIRPVAESDGDGVSLGDSAVMPCPDGSSLRVTVVDWLDSIAVDDRGTYAAELGSPVLWWAEVVS